MSMLALRLERWPLAVRLTLTMTALVVAAVLGVTLVSIHREQQIFQRELQQQASSLLDALEVAAEDRLYSLDYRFLNDIVQKLANEQIVLGARFYEARGRILADAHDPSLTYRSQTDPFGQRLIDSEGPLFEWRPDRLLAGRAVVVGRQRLGAVSLELSTGPLEAKMDTGRDQGLGLALLAGFAGTIAASLVGRSITGPLRELTAATQNVAAGDLTRRLTAHGSSELATLAGSFNSMTDQLRNLIENLEHLVQKRTAELTRANRTLKAEVAERRQAEESLERLRRQNELILNSAGDGILGLDLQGKTTFINPAATRMLGYDGAELIGQPFQKVFRPSKPDGVAYRPEECPISGTLQEGSVGHVVDSLFWRNDGASFPVEYTSTPISEHDRLVGATVIFKDISERKEVELQRQAYAQTEKLRALGQMASGVAHDLNQYLGLVAGHAEIALHALGQPRARTDKLRESLDTVLRAAFDGAESVTRLQAFARPRQDAAPQRIELGALLQDVATLTGPRWRDTSQQQGRPISLDVEVSGDLVIDGSAAELREAFTNLVFNAVDALPEGGTIRLSASRSGDDVVAEVSDSGVGMSSEIQARVFEPFFSTKGERGTGLGLAMVFGIMERHGGKVTLESHPGRGSTFRFAFPASASVALSREEPPEIDAVAPLRILAVDDAPNLSKMLSLMLAPDGHTVVVAASGEEALQRLAEQPFDLLISDVGMGAGMNGWDLAEQVRATYPNIRFCLATGWGAMIDSTEARDKGVHGVVGKPYRLADIRRLIADSIEVPAAR